MSLWDPLGALQVDHAMIVTTCDYSGNGNICEALLPFCPQHETFFDSPFGAIRAEGGQLRKEEQNPLPILLGISSQLWEIDFRHFWTLRSVDKRPRMIRLGNVCVSHKGIHTNPKLWYLCFVAFKTGYGLFCYLTCSWTKVHNRLDASYIMIYVYTWIIKVLKHWLKLFCCKKERGPPTCTTTTTGTFTVPHFSIADDRMMHYHK